MTQNEIKAAELRGYSRGYNAGKRRKQRDISQEQRRRERQAFLDRAFISVLPAAMQAEGWKFGDKPITSTDDRIRLALIWAENALKMRPFA